MRMSKVHTIVSHLVWTSNWDPAEMSSNEKLYKAMIWPNGDQVPGRRVSVFASSLTKARERIELEFKTKEIFGLHNPEDAEKSR